ncbi:MAG: protease pro-enzyme activation domain-containing protein [Ktedonobacterales bacterium]
MPDFASSMFSEYSPLAGSERKLVPGSQLIGPSDPGEVISVSIRLRSRRPSSELEAHATSLGLQLPGARTYLSAEEYTATYGADPADMQKVEAFAQRYQLSILRAHAAQRVVVVSGTAAALSAAFDVKLVRYTSPEGEYRGRIGPVHLPPDIAGIVEGVFGLDNRKQARPHIILPATAERLRRASNTQATRRDVQPASYMPPQVGGFYNFPSNLDGSGQCVGLIEFGGGFGASDLQAYFGQLNMQVPNITSVSIDGTPNKPGADPDSDGEVLLDIEVSASLAPGAKFVVYFAPFTEQGWVDVIGAAVHDTQNRPRVLSISWGYTEGQDIWTAQAVQAVNQAFQAAAVLGITICAAAGDDGSEDQLDDGLAHVDFPASSPYVLGCGGTSIQVSGNTITSETVWNDGTRSNGGGAGGGGISVMNALPSWQKGIVPPSCNPDHHVGRGVPDVAGDADENSGYTIIVDGQTATNVGGTSAVAPLWAALIARINQQLGKPVGYLTPLLYGNLGKSSAFHDITKGNNDPTGQLGGYFAGPGWDACSGWGSPDGTNLLNALAGSGSTGGSAGAGSSGGSTGTSDPVVGGAIPTLPIPSVGGSGGGGALLWTTIVLIVLIVIGVIAALAANHAI